ncbi:MAG: 23S rRNA (guanosine(2251)-2'-O)-methyltransferase RlmB [Alphaproteobacteria bacterium]|nr:23S rRNA (guanosine(2251)-2'-O)-methyltransferase RlmB [Alphaproteobacteria bacterium]
MNHSATRPSFSRVRPVREPAPKKGARLIVRSPPPLKPRGAGASPPHRTPRRQFEAETGGPSWLWGTHAALAALANPNRRIERIVATRNAAQRLPEGLDVHILDPDALDGMLPPGAVHQGLAVRAAPLEPMTLEAACLPLDGRPVLALDQITDPQNVGALFRSAAAFGARAVLLQDRKSPPLTGVLAKAAAGAIEIVPHVRVVNLARALSNLGNWGYRTIALEGEAAQDLATALGGDGPAAFALGAEGKGLRPAVAEACAARARIPIAPNMESLNVSVAAAVALYEAARRS